MIISLQIDIFHRATTMNLYMKRIKIKISKLHKLERAQTKLLQRVSKRMIVNLNLFKVMQHYLLIAKKDPQFLLGQDAAQKKMARTSLETFSKD